MVKGLRGFICLAALLIFSACGSPGDEISCMLSIYTDEGAVLAETEIIFNEGRTVLDILKKATRDAGIHMEYTGAGGAAYVKGIANLYEFDQGPESGWVYTVNGETRGESAGAFKPGRGDVVVWQYIRVFTP